MMKAKVIRFKTTCQSESMFPFSPLSCWHVVMEIERSEVGPKRLMDDAFISQPTISGQLIRQIKF